MRKGPQPHNSVERNEKLGLGWQIPFLAFSGQAHTVPGGWLPARRSLFSCFPEGGILE